MFRWEKKIPKTEAAESKITLELSYFLTLRCLFICRNWPSSELFSMLFPHEFQWTAAQFLSCSAPQPPPSRRRHRKTAITTGVIPQEDKSKWTVTVSGTENCQMGHSERCTSLFMPNFSIINTFLFFTFAVPWESFCSPWTFTHSIMVLPQTGGHRHKVVQSDNAWFSNVLFINSDLKNVVRICVHSTLLWCH